jgi:hypothetical protein
MKDYFQLLNGELLPGNIRILFFFQFSVTTSSVKADPECFPSRRNEAFLSEETVP